MNGIEAAFVGKLMKPGELKTSKAGKAWCSVSLLVGEGDAGMWVRIAAFGEMAEAVARLDKGSNLYVEGRLTLQSWTAADGVERSGLNIAASRIEPLGQIGRRRPADAQRKGAISDAKASYAKPYDTDARPAGRDPLNGGDAIPF